MLSGFLNGCKDSENRDNHRGINYSIHIQNLLKYVNTHGCIYKVSWVFPHQHVHIPLATQNSILARKQESFLTLISLDTSTSTYIRTCAAYRLLFDVSISSLLTQSIAPLASLVEYEDDSSLDSIYERIVLLYLPRMSLVPV